MSFFNWFSSKPRHFKSDVPGSVEAIAALAAQPATPPAALERPAPTSVQTVEDRRLRRHARREQLYGAVREAMTRSGVLSASYKFKVLSLDQIGNEFLVMVDLSMAFDGITGQLGAMESLIARQAKARFGITVPTVYWRMDAGAATRAPARPAPLTPAMHPLPVSATPVAAPTPPVARPVAGAPPVPMHRDSVLADEVAAFRHALVAASHKAPAPAVDATIKTRVGPHSYTLLTGFEDTEMPESGAIPALSRTQYGDLN
jgi:hypothetical protein